MENYLYFTLVPSTKQLLLLLVNSAPLSNLDLWHGINLLSQDMRLNSSRYDRGMKSLPIRS